MDIRVNVFRRQNGTDQNIGGKPFVLFCAFVAGLQWSCNHP
jgi:hypothetical protein